MEFLKFISKKLSHSNYVLNDFSFNFFAMTYEIKCFLQILKICIYEYCVYRMMYYTFIHNFSVQNYRLTFTGHSLGGALAALAAFLFDGGEENNERLQLYTFGEPRVGNAQFARNMERYVPERCQKFIIYPLQF